MTYYDSFDCKINCEEVSPVTESEAQDGYSNWSDEDQRLWEAEQERLKKWTGNYSPIDDGDSYAGIAI
jgi:hypothetical protein